MGAHLQVNTYQDHYTFLTVAAADVEMEECCRYVEEVQMVQWRSWVRKGGLRCCLVHLEEGTLRCWCCPWSRHAGHLAASVGVGSVEEVLEVPQTEAEAPVAAAAVVVGREG